MAVKLTKFKYGNIFLIETDFYITKTIIASGQYCDEEADLFRRILQPTDNVIEVGANIGSLTIPISQMIPNGVIYAIEPQQYVFNTLCANLAINDLRNVKPIKLAVGDSTKIVHLPIIDYDKITNFGGIEIKDGNKGEPIQQNTLDNIFYGIDKVKLLKIDVEGMEPQVLEGGFNLIRKHRPFIYCENDRGENSEKIISHLKAAGYKIHEHSSTVFNKVNFNNNEINPFDKNYICINILAVPEEVEFSL